MSKTDCPYCHNRDIKIVKRETKEVLPDKEFVDYSYCYDYVLSCICEKCHTHYRVIDGYYRYIVYNDKYETLTHDIKLLISFRSDIEERGFDIVSTHDLNDNEIYYFIPYIDKYPYIISEEQFMDIITSPDNGKKLSKKIYDDRYKKEM